MLAQPPSILFNLRLEPEQRLRKSIFHVSPHRCVCLFRVAADNGFEQFSVKARGQDSTLSGNVQKEVEKENMGSFNGLQEGLAMGGLSDARVQSDVLRA
jgi:hypothetical protein